MPDYSKAVIYRIVCNQTGEVYIGATVEPLWKRFSNHKSDAKHKERCCMSKQIIDRGDCDIELVEEYPCETASISAYHLKPKMKKKKYSKNIVINGIQSTVQ